MKPLLRLTFPKRATSEQRTKKGYDKHYIYTDESGNTCFVVERKKKDDGSKSFALHSKKQHKSQGYHKWMEAEYPEPRPIYNLQRLYQVTTWSCGAYSVLKNNWEPVIKYQNIYICPDNDKNGEMAMHKLVKHLKEKFHYDLTCIKWIRYSEHFPDGWDLADDIPEKFTEESGVSDNHTLIGTLGAPYKDCFPDYQSIWHDIDTKVEKKEINKEKSQRLLQLGESVVYIEELYIYDEAIV